MTGANEPSTITAAGPTGFHLGTASFFVWIDWVLGQWVGELKVRGQPRNELRPAGYRPPSPSTAVVVHVADPVGGGVGVGNAETFSPVAVRFPNLASVRRIRSCKGYSLAVTSVAARSPERTAPSINPYMTAEVSVPAQWMRPHGSRRAVPNSVSTPGGAWPIIPPPE